MIRSIEEKHIPKDIVEKLIIYRINSLNIDEAAGKRWLFPVDNYLLHMTYPENDTFEFLAIPEGRCPFLNEKGCISPESKPLECKLYPFLLFKLQFFIEWQWCPAIYKTKCSDWTYREEIGKILAEYAIFAEKHREEYRNNLKNIKLKYNLPVLDYISNSCELEIGKMEEK